MRLAIAIAVLALVARAEGGGGAAATCAYRGRLPDSRCTPGAIFAGAGATAICRPGYSRSVRDVPAARKRRVYAEYGITRHPRGSYEVDHLVPLELGGSNSLANLWPQPAPDFHQKDALENALHRSVCARRMRLARAQRAIAHDWHAEWLRLGRPAQLGARQ